MEWEDADYIFIFGWTLSFEFTVQEPTAQAL